MEVVKTIRIPPPEADDRGALPAAHLQSYLRRCRRLRAIHRHNPSHLYRALKKTGTQLVAAPAPSPAERFTRIVEESGTQAFLLYSLRQQLLRKAEYLGIPRFEANLIIATVRHRLERSPQPPTPRRSWPTALLVALLLQFLIAVAILRIIL